MIEIKDKKSCCGCQACKQVCPKMCISICMDKEGFLYPVVDSSACINCHLCESVCPFLNQSETVKPFKVLGAVNKNDNERVQSSSGGIFILLAKAILKENGVVFGAVFDEEWNVKHTYAENIEDVIPMLQSKYVQSNIGDTFSQVKKILKEGRKVLFCGTPCQILGLRRFLRKKYENLLTVDFLCHGVPSPGVWNRYVVRELEPIARSATAGKNSVLNLSLNVKSSIEDISFRDKTYRGWKKFSFVVRKKSPSKGDQNTVLLSDSHYTNPYMKGFLSDIFLRPSCYECKCKNGRSGSDITLGDFWCAERVDETIDDDKGLSLVLINNSELDVLDKEQISYKEFLYDDVKKLNGGFVENHICDKRRRFLFYQFYAFMKMNNSIKYSRFIAKLINKLLKVCK